MKFATSLIPRLREVHLPPGQRCSHNSSERVKYSQSVPCVACADSIIERRQTFSSRGTVPNTPKNKSSSPQKQGSRSKSSRLFLEHSEANTHVTFESYQSLLFLDSKLEKDQKRFTPINSKLSL